MQKDTAKVGGLPIGHDKDFRTVIATIGMIQRHVLGGCELIAVGNGESIRQTRIVKISLHGIGDAQRSLDFRGSTGRKDRGIDRDRHHIAANLRDGVVGPGTDFQLSVAGQQADPACLRQQSIPSCIVASTKPGFEGPAGGRTGRTDHGIAPGRQEGIPGQLRFHRGAGPIGFVTAAGGLHQIIGPRKVDASKLLGGIDRIQPGLVGRDVLPGRAEVGFGGHDHPPDRTSRRARNQARILRQIDPVQRIPAQLIRMQATGFVLRPGTIQLEKRRSIRDQAIVEMGIVWNLAPGIQILRATIVKSHALGQ